MSSDSEIIPQFKFSISKFIQNSFSGSANKNKCLKVNSKIL